MVFFYKDAVAVCEHVYKNMGSEVCPLCKRPTHEVDWVNQNKLAREWREANPNTKYGGWWSI